MKTIKFAKFIVVSSLLFLGQWGRSATVATQVQTAIAYSFNVDETEVTSDKFLSKDLGADAYELQILAKTLQSQLGVNASLEEMISFKTVKSVIDYYQVQSKALSSMK